MSYTAEDIDRYVEEEYYGSWHEFCEQADSDEEPVKNPEVVPPDHIVDENGYLLGPEKEFKNWNGGVEKYRSLVYRKLDQPGAYIEGVGQVTEEDCFGGEGQGDDYWIVFKVTDDDGGVRYFKRFGYHVSHDGSHLDGPTIEVEPGEKVIKVWNAKK